MKEIKSEDIWNEEKLKKEDMTKFDDKEDELFDPWEHLYEEESEFQKIKTPKVKKVKKEREYPIRRKRKR